MSVIFEVYRINRSGPRMDPSGTPKRMLQTLDVLVPTRTECVLSVRNEAIHLSAEAVMPNFNSRTCKRMEGSTQSNAALKSKRCGNEPGVEGCNDVVVHFHDRRLSRMKSPET